MTAGKRLALAGLALAGVLIAGVACEESAAPAGGVSSVELQAAADVAAARETAGAQGTAAVLDGLARSTAQAAQATQQVLDTRERELALSIEATRAAWSFWSTAEAQAQAARETATAGAATSTAGAQAQAAEAAVYSASATVQAAAAQATAQAVQRANDRERITQPLATGAPWVLGLLLLAGGGWLFWRVAVVVEDRLRVIRRQADEGEPVILISRERVSLPLRNFSPVLDATHGQERAPLLAPVDVQERTTARQQATGVVLAQQAGRVALARAAGRRGLLPVGGGGGNGNGAGMLPGVQPGEAQGEAAAEALQWPARVPLSGLLGGGQPSVNGLVLGVTALPDGRLDVVRAPMAGLVHVAVGGSSGWGKSVFLRALAYQLAQSAEPVDLVLIDLEGVTFGPFAQSRRVLYPVADSEQDALAVLQELTCELDRRRALFGQVGAVDLAEYNNRAGEALAPVVLLVDESTALLQSGGVEGAIKTLVLRARKYGLWCVLGGQDWKATSLDTAIRNMLSTRVQFKAMSASQSRVLLERNGAEHLPAPGRALALLPGRDVIELQAPYVPDGLLMGLDGGGPRSAMPVANSEEADRAEQIRQLATQGVSKRKIQEQIFGYVGGAAFAAVNAALGENGGSGGNGSGGITVPPAGTVASIGQSVQ